MIVERRLSGQYSELVVQQSESGLALGSRSAPALGGVMVDRAAGAAGEFPRLAAGRFPPLVPAPLRVDIGCRKAPFWFGLVKKSNTGPKKPPRHVS